MRDFKKRKGGRENDIVAKISQDLLQIQAKIYGHLGAPSKYAYWI
jgi:hypothetical protein